MTDEARNNAGARSESWPQIHPAIPAYNESGRIPKTLEAGGGLHPGARLGRGSDRGERRLERRDSRGGAGVCARLRRRCG